MNTLWREDGLSWKMKNVFLYFFWLPSSSLFSCTKHFDCKFCKINVLVDQQAHREGKRDRRLFCYFLFDRLKLCDSMVVTIEKMSHASILDEFTSYILLLPIKTARQNGWRQRKVLAGRWTNERYSQLKRNNGPTKWPNVGRVWQGMNKVTCLRLVGRVQNDFVTN